MVLRLDNCGKKFEKHWIFRQVSYSFSSPDRVAILGPNGSGKSTFVKLISGYLSPNEGIMHLPVEQANWYKHISMAAPWIDLIEDLTLTELIRFHAGFRSFISSFTPKDIIAISELEHAASKQIRNFSSGMKQRLKLTLAILTESDVLILDEPCSNLDRNAILWYQNTLKTYLNDRLLFVASNHQLDEIFLCSEQIELHKG